MDQPTLSVCLWNHTVIKHPHPTTKLILVTSRISFVDTSAFTAIVKDVIASKSPPLRPHVPTDAASVELRDIMIKAWAEEPLLRPSFKDIKSRFKLVPGVNKSVSGYNSFRAI